MVVLCDHHKYHANHSYYWVATLREFFARSVHRMQSGAASAQIGRKIEGQNCLSAVCGGRASVIRSVGCGFFSRLARFLLGGGAVVLLGEIRFLHLINVSPGGRHSVYPQFHPSALFIVLALGSIPTEWHDVWLAAARRLFFDRNGLNQRGCRPILGHATWHGPAVYAKKSV